MPFNSIFDHPSNEVTGTETVKTPEVKPEAAAEMSYEDIGRARLERATQKVDEVKQNLGAKAQRVWSKIKGFGGKAMAAGRTLALSAFAAPEMAKDAAAYAGEKIAEGTEIVRDAVTEKYNAAAEKFRAGQEAIAARVNAAKENLGNRIQTAKNGFQERVTSLKERWANYAAARDKYLEARRALFATPL